jgi:hypothetical protein
VPSEASGKLLRLSFGVNPNMFDSIIYAKVAASGGQIHKDKWQLGVQTEGSNSRIAGKIGGGLRGLPSITDSSATSSPRLKTSQPAMTILAESLRSLNEPKASIFSVPGA